MKEEHFVFTVPFSHFNCMWAPFLAKKKEKRERERESQLKEEFFQTDEAEWRGLACTDETLRCTRSPGEFLFLNQTFFGPLRKVKHLAVCFLGLLSVFYFFNLTFYMPCS